MKIKIAVITFLVSVSAFAEDGYLYIPADSQAVAIETLGWYSEWNNPRLDETADTVRYWVTHGPLSEDVIEQVESLGGMVVRDSSAITEKPFLQDIHLKRPREEQRLQILEEQEIQVDLIEPKP